MMETYIVSKGETILDVSMNATGSPLNIKAIIDANELQSWTPQLVAGMALTIPDTVQRQVNNLREMVSHPVSDSGFITDEEFEHLTLELENLIS